jgi:hypothetical protein
MNSARPLPRHLVEIAWYIEQCPLDVPALVHLLHQQLLYLQRDAKITGRLECAVCRLLLFAADEPQSCYVEILTSPQDRVLAYAAIRMVAQEVFCVLERAGCALTVHYVTDGLYWAGT